MSVAAPFSVVRPPDPTNLPPHSIEAEQQVLSAILIDEAIPARLRPLISPESFYREAHQVAYRTMLALADAGKPVEPVAFVESMQAQGVWDRFGGNAYYDDVAKAAAHSANLLHHAAIVAEDARRRRLIEVAEEVNRAARQRDRSAEDVFREGFVSFVSRSEGTSPSFSGPPRAIVEMLRPVPEFNPALLPTPFRSFAVDVADRMQCAVEFVVVALVVSLSAVLGRKLGIRPKRHDDWTVVANLWGMVVGRPGVLKTPALDEAMRAIKRLAAKAMERYEAEVQEFKGDQLVAAAKKEAAAAEIKKGAKKGMTDEAMRERAREATADVDAAEPVCRRYLTNDGTTAKIGELLNENPNGLMVFRDELVGWLRTLDMQGHEGDRTFNLEAWNGNGSFTYDRIGRGTIHVPGLCLSILGGIQPGPLASYLRGATTGVGDDGLISRFQLAVYPDQGRAFRVVDRYPNLDAKERAYGVFEAIDRLDPASIGAEVGDADDLPYLRFADDAQEFFYRWWADLEAKLRAQESPAIESHLAKYRSLMPSLALLFHVVDLADPQTADGARRGPVTLEAARRAAAWCEFLEEHARRIYATGAEGDVQPARTLASRLGNLKNPFTAREVFRKAWSGLADLEAVDRALGILEEHGWIKGVEVNTHPVKGGRPTTHYYIHPDIHGEGR